MNMQIIIPMSGFGERFRRVGYAVPKPLIEIEGKPMIAHVIDLFPGENDFIFICNQEHLNIAEYHMEAIVRTYCPTARIVGISPHKLGPVYAVQQAEHLLKLNDPVIVNYCDFTCYWDWEHFKYFVKHTKCEGALPAYKGFHPHSLGSTNYAYMREENGRVLDIQEKLPYTDNRMEEYASSGTYYFATAQIMCDAFRTIIEKNINVGGEYYVSLAYKALLTNKQLVTVYPLQHFMQWGTPEDLEEYQGWYDVFLRFMEEKRDSCDPMGSLVIPMAGLGKRFADAGYTITKPLIEVLGKPMVVQAALSLPSSLQQSFVLRIDMQGYAEIIKTLCQNFPNAITETVETVTDGQACSALIGLDALEKNVPIIAEPITFAACDSAVQYDEKKFVELCKNKNVDVIVWAVRKHANAARNPQMFGWIDADESGRIKNISVKSPLKNPANDPIVIGTFTFRKAQDFRKCVEKLVARNGRINGEFYLDSCINDAIDLGLNCHIFEVDGFISFGTPNDLKTFEYWQSCFHKWAGHPYRLKEEK